MSGSRSPAGSHKAYSNTLYALLASQRPLYLMLVSYETREKKFDVSHLPNARIPVKLCDSGGHCSSIRIIHGSRFQAPSSVWERRSMERDGVLT